VRGITTKRQRIQRVELPKGIVPQVEENNQLTYMTKNVKKEAFYSVNHHAGETPHTEEERYNEENLNYQ
jgi:hypothetical protein